MGSSMGRYSENNLILGAQVLGSSRSSRTGSGFSPLPFLVPVLVTLPSEDIPSCIFLSNWHLIPEPFYYLNHILGSWQELQNPLPSSSWITAPALIHTLVPLLPLAVFIRL